MARERVVTEVGGKRCRKAAPEIVVRIRRNVEVINGDMLHVCSADRVDVTVFPHPHSVPPKFRADMQNCHKLVYVPVGTV